jgi:hypothetical protein
MTDPTLFEEETRPTFQDPLWRGDRRNRTIETVALAAREDAIRRADEHADTEWKDRAYAVLVAIAGRGVPFTADDVWDSLAAYSEATHEPAALGPVFRRAAKAQLIRKTGRLIPSRHPRRHRDLTEWVAA